MEFLIALVIGAVAGWLAGTIVRGSGFGLLGDIITGALGAVVGAWLLQRIGIALDGGLLGSVISATVGAIIVLLVLRLAKRA